jgi:hypothetical protein
LCHPLAIHQQRKLVRTGRRKQTIRYPKNHVKFSQLAGKTGPAAPGINIFIRFQARRDQVYLRTDNASFSKKVP